MNIVQPYARILYPELKTREDGIDLLRKIETIARVSHRSEEAQTADSWERFISAVVLGHGDWSVTEHIGITAEFLTDRGITHEIVRHRIAAFTQESTRFVNYEKKMPPSFVYPRVWDSEMDPDWVEAITACENGYRKLIAKGWAPQDARSVFPNALSAKIIVTFNFRMWRHFFLMRSSKEAHHQARQIINPLLAEFQRLIPLLYDDIVPESRQIDNMRSAR
jgi:thymidylate synthase (FAD)